MAAKNIFKKIISLIFGLAVLIFLVFILYFIAPSPSIENKITDTDGLNIQNIQNGQSDPGLPSRLVIPSINVDAKITYVGLDSNGAVGAPDGPYDTAWYKLGPRPGVKGSAVITGHYGPWRTGENSVFDDLHKLKKGDQIYVRDDKGSLISFAVKEIRTYDLNESVPEVFIKNDGIYLNLITCSGEWIQDQKTYTQRLVVFTQAI